MRTLGRVVLVLMLALTPVISAQAAEGGNSLWDSIKEQGAEWYDKAEKAPEVYDNLKDKGADLYDKAKEKAPELRDKAAEKLGEAQEAIGEFRNEQESEFWQRFEDQVGVPVDSNVTSAVSEVTTIETKDTVSEDSTELLTTDETEIEALGSAKSTDEEGKPETETETTVKIAEELESDLETDDSYKTNRTSEQTEIVKCLVVVIVLLVIALLVAMFAFFRVCYKRR